MNCASKVVVKCGTDNLRISMRLAFGRKRSIRALYGRLHLQTSANV
jgi:hypothetical protein